MNANFKGSRLAVTVLMIIVGNASVFAATGEREVRDRKAVEANKKLETDSKGGGSAHDKEALRLLEASKAAAAKSDSAKSSTAKVAPLRVFDARIGQIKSFLDEAAKNGSGDRRIQESIATVHSALEAIESNRKIGDNDRSARIGTISLLTQFMAKNEKSTAIWSADGMQILASFSRAFSTDITDLVAAKKQLEQDNLEKVMQKNLDGNPEKVAAMKQAITDYENADAQQIVQAMIKLMNSLTKDPSKIEKGQYNSGSNLKETTDALKNINEIMLGFDANMRTGRFATINLGLLKAVITWAEQHGKDVNKAVSCFFNPRTV